MRLYFVRHGQSEAVVAEPRPHGLVCLDWCGEQVAATPR